MSIRPAIEWLIYGGWFLLLSGWWVFSSILFLVGLIGGRERTSK